MIPPDSLALWRKHAPWALDEQVEQDLVIARALVDIFSDPFLHEAVAFRGGTALHKLLLQPAARYSEDIDLVQTRPGPIGPVLDAFRQPLSWLGTPRSKVGKHSSRLEYRFLSERPPPRPLKLKVEINTREQFTLDGYRDVPLTVESKWFSGSASIRTFSIEELLGTKLRALYQRNKGRDLFDLERALEVLRPDRARIVAHFLEYVRREGNSVTRADFVANLAAKSVDPDFRSNTAALLRPEADVYDVDRAREVVESELIALLP